MEHEPFPETIRSEPDGFNVNGEDWFSTHLCKVYETIE